MKFTLKSIQLRVSFAVLSVLLYNIYILFRGHDAAMEKLAIQVRRAKLVA